MALPLREVRARLHPATSDGGRGSRLSGLQFGRRFLSAFGFRAVGRDRGLRTTGDRAHKAGPVDAARGGGGPAR